MNINPQKPWLHAGQEYIHIIYGNRSGLELLRNAIGQVLEGGETSALIGDGENGIEMVELDETPPAESSPKTLKQRAIFYAIVGLVCTVPFAAIYGFYHFIKLLIQIL